MTAKLKKRKRQKARRRGVRVGNLRASVEDDLLLLADQETGAEGRWNRPRKRRISWRVDVEVAEWFKSKGPGYEMRMNLILRRVMVEGKKRIGRGRGIGLHSCQN
ncbi:MAG TPA: BrnA antitoxin family protein [Candidatus Binatia bacterium]|nr:BrnA antitoxin family protein [Candidatus Binatia bacterium]